MSTRLLQEHINRAPEMEPTDAVKFLFQSEFGCGHILGPQAECAQWVKSEMASTPENAAMPCADLIGNRLCRLNLASPAVRALSPETIARMMAITAEHVKGSMERFEERLTELNRLADSGALPFSKEALEAYLTQYRASGCPPVSHSARYRAAYAPAYRVVLSDFATLLPLIAMIEERLKKGHAFVALDGDCGAGKTTLSGLLAALYGVEAIHMDDYFLPFPMRTAARLVQPGGNVHYERFEAEILRGLQAGGEIRYDRYDCATGEMIPKRLIPASVVLIEGSYSHHPCFERAYNALNVLRAFVWVEPDEQLRRLSLRSPDMLKRFVEEWIPLEKKYFEAYDIRRRANIALESKPWEDEA